MTISGVALQCPTCKSEMASLTGPETRLECNGCGASYPVVSGRPVLFDLSNEVFSVADYRAVGNSSASRTKRLAQWIPDPSLNLSRGQILGRLRQVLDERGAADVLVVGGGRQRDALDPLLRSVRAHRVVYSDVDSGADVDLYCDGHDLPFVDGSFDAVITTAVLEHVLYPERVATEISRILRRGGLLYSELPFMQQVHEGAYDFTRYSLSGHRRLFNDFAEIDSGMVAGPATALVWAIENFALAFCRRSLARNLAKAACRVTLSWIKQFDRLLAHRPEAMDGASCTYFYGSKADRRVKDAEIIRRYVGAKHLSHV